MLEFSPALHNTSTADLNQHKEGVQPATDELRSALSFGVAANGQLLLTKGLLHLVEPVGEKALATAAEKAATKGLGSAFMSGVSEGMRTSLGPEVEKLLPPLVIGGFAVMGTAKIAHSFSAAGRGDRAQESADFSDGCGYYSASAGALIGAVAATRFGVSRQAGAAVGALAGELAYSGSKYVVDKSLNWLHELV